MIASTQELTDIIQVDPHKLKPHALNTVVYGAMDDPEFVNACEDGIREPVVCSRDYVMISGHRRREAAILHGHPTIPCIVREDVEGDSPLHEMELLLANKQRRKTQEQIARECANLLRIQRLLNPPKPAGRPVEKSKLEPTPIKSDKPSVENIKAVAQQVGVGVSKAQQAVRVVQAIDEAEESGDVETATEIRETLSKKSIAAADKVRSKKSPKPKPAFAAVEKVFGQLRRAVDDEAKVQGGQGVHYQAVDKCMEKLWAAIVKWKQD